MFDKYIVISSLETLKDVLRRNLNCTHVSNVYKAPDRLFFNTRATETAMHVENKDIVCHAEKILSLVYLNI